MRNRLLASTAAATNNSERSRLVAGGIPSLPDPAALVTILLIFIFQCTSLNAELV